MNLFHYSCLLLLAICLSTYSSAQCISGNCISGNGIKVYDSGARYIGSFEFGRRDGLGTCFYPDGGKYFGYWRSDQREGNGIRYFANGEEQRGFWRDNRLVNEDPNLIIQLDGEVATYEAGCIDGNCTDGNGTFLAPDGTIYTGDFVQGKKHGYGACYYPGGMVYRGRWLKDLPSGNGTMMYPDGRQEQGFWKEGQLIADMEELEERVAQDKDPQEKTGCLQGNCYNGQGVYAFDNGDKYSGTFREGRPHGQGIVYYDNGERYEGMLSKGKLHGRGTLHYPDGRIISGYWADGDYVRSLPSESVAPVQPRPRPDPSAQSEPTVKVWAVVIGIAAYEHMRALRYTDDDAYRVYAFLKSPEGGAVADEQMRVLIDESATRSNILAAMRRIFSQAGPDDLILLYYSGHGIPGAFVPIDYDGLHNKVFHREISSIMAQSPAKFKLCIADACHSGGMFTSRSDVQHTLNSYYSKLAEASAGTALIMSSKSNETSLEASGLRQGVFSHFLIRGLKGEADSSGDDIVSISELYEFVYDRVRKYTGYQQSPVIRGRYDAEMPVSVKR